MNRISKAFENKKAFIAFITGGDPSIEKTEEYIYEIERAGASLIEIGIPFSDPIAEGPVIQNANIRSLSNGTTTDKLFDMVKRIRKNTQIPLVFMTYLNPVFHYGYEKFFSNCKECGIDGIIIPDLPYEEKNEVSDVAGKYEIDVISLIAPTSKNRIKTIACDAQGFIYVVSSMGVTGVRSQISSDLKSMVTSIKEANNKIPVCVGFGINTPKQAADISSYSDGIIIGSAIVKIIAQYKDEAASHIYEYVKSITDAINW